MSVTHKGAPTFEIMGDPAAIRGRIAVMRDRASDFERIAWSLQEISVSGWSGRAAERFHEHFKLQPEKWWCASATFGRAADAWEVYASALEQAQTRAAEAKVAYEEGIAAVEAALAEQKWAAEHRQIGIFGLPEVDLSYHPERDTRPGEAKQAQAVADFEAAVSDTDAAGETLAQTLYEQANRSPDPSWAPVHFMKRVGAGIFDGVWGLLSMSYGLALEEMRDYGRYMLGWITWDELWAKYSQKMISFEDLVALRDAIWADPKGFAKKMWDALINAEGWEDDPGAALGELVPAAVLAALTAGGGNAARAVAVLESLPIIGEGMMLRDMGMGLGTLALKGAGRLGIGADGAVGRMSSHLDDYLRTHGMEDLADEWKEKRLRVLPRSADDLMERIPLNPRQQESGPPPAEGLVKDVRGADLVHEHKLILGENPDGSSRTYDEWNQLNAHLESRNGRDEYVPNWPEDDGYAKEPASKRYTSLSEYVKEHGADVDRIGHPDGKFMGAIEDGNVASFEERSLPPDSVNEYYYQYEFAVEELPENWTIRAGKAAPWAGQPGGATQLQVFDENNRAVPVSKLLGEGILKGKDKPIGLPK